MHNILGVIKRVSYRLAALLLAVVVLIPVSLYLPQVQSYVKDAACTQLHKSTGMTLSVERLRLRFPLRLELEGVTLLEAGGDTMLTARQLLANVSLLPLLGKRVEIPVIDLKDAYCRMCAPDATMCLRAQIEQFRATGASTRLTFDSISVSDAVLNGGSVALHLRNDTTPMLTDTSGPRPLAITAGAIDLSNIRYDMSIEGTVDSLGVAMPLAAISDVSVNTGTRRVKAERVKIDSVSAAYIIPRISAKPYESDKDTVASKSKPWDVCVSHIRFTGREALYTAFATVPSRGFDPDYIQATGIDLSVDSLRSFGSELRLQLLNLTATERCGLSLDASGAFYMDSTIMQLVGISIATEHSHIWVDAITGLDVTSLSPASPIGLQTHGVVAASDIATVLPATGPLVGKLPPADGLHFNADIHGTSRHIDVTNVDLSWPRTIQIEASGGVDYPFSTDRIGGRIIFDGQLFRPEVVSSFVPNIPSPLRIPPASIKGDVTYRPGEASGAVGVSVNGTSLALEGEWRQRSEGYNVKLDTYRFPLQAFLPTIGVCDLTASIKASGRGYNPYSPSTHARASVNIADVTYRNHNLGGVDFTASLDTCRLHAQLNSSAPLAKLDATFSAWLHQNDYTWNLSADVANMDLYALGVSAKPLQCSTLLYTCGGIKPTALQINAEADVNDLKLQIDTVTMACPELTAKIFSTDSITKASLEIGDLIGHLSSSCSLKELTVRIAAVADTLTQAIMHRRVDVPALQHTLPMLNFTLQAGSNNIVSRYLSRTSDINFTDANMWLNNDSVLALEASVQFLTMGRTRIDTATLQATQQGDYLVYSVQADNNPGTMDKFAHMRLSGYLSGQRLVALADQQNLAGEQGFLIGFDAQSTDSLLMLHLIPEKPVIAYHPWTLNHDNCISYRYSDHHIDADLDLSSDSSRVHIYTQRVPLQNTIESDSAQWRDDLVVNLSHIDVAQWLSISPFAPPLNAMLNTNLRLHWDPAELTASGAVNIDNLTYDNQRVGSFGLDLDVSNQNRSHALRADIGLSVDGTKVITASGALNDSTARIPFLLDFSMIHFPLNTVNAFLPKSMAQISGTLNGAMKITGSLSEPMFNGYINFDSAAVSLGITGSQYSFSSQKIPVDSNMVHLQDFSILGLNANPLEISGTVDARRISEIAFDLKASTRDMQLLNSSRARGEAQVYGRAFIDLDATVKGNTRLMLVNASMSILPGTNLTYVLTSGADAITSQGSYNDMVRFVSFADTAQVLKADSLQYSSMAMLLDADISIEEGVTLNADLSPDGKNRASVEGSGNFSYSLTPMNGIGRLTGRYNISGGYVRYTPQLQTGSYTMAIMSEKNFSLHPDSYIAFNGNVLDPRLSIHAIDRMRANVTQQGQDSRLVNFDVGLSVGGSLEKLDVQFDLSTDDDMTISNELASMSAQQRANQAMNMLLYNRYTGPGTKGTANLGGNPLYSFLASQLNNWTASAIHGVDITFGIDQYDQSSADGVKSTTTSYSYRVSKTLFNDRFKIVVGGNYSTDADADENLEQNLINDIAFEYMINRSGTMYMRLFRHTGFESILEGEITQTGVGFVLKRKLNTLRNIFHFTNPFNRPSNATVK